MSDPALLLGLALVASLNFYALLGGADYGGGLWDLLASGPTAERQRTTIARAIGPVWEANPNRPYSWNARVWPSALIIR